jgi:hypothetical protein
MQLKCGTSGNAVPTMLLKCGTQVNAVPTLLRKCDNPCVYDTILATWSLTMCADVYPPLYTEYRNLQLYTPPVALLYGIEYEYCVWRGTIGTVDVWNYQNNSWLALEAEIRCLVQKLESNSWFIELLVAEQGFLDRPWQKTIAASSPFGTHTQTYVCKEYGRLSAGGSVTLEEP